METCEFNSWPYAQEKFGLHDNEEDAWGLFTSSFMSKWHGILDRGIKEVRLGMWIGVFTKQQ